MADDRIDAIANLIPECGRIADIGCDHGYLTLTLVTQRQNIHVVACDKSAPSLDKARKLVGKHGLERYVTFSLGDGADVLCCDDVDAAALCGMGIDTITRMIAYGEEHRHNAMSYVVQPQGNIADFRMWMASHGFVSEDESLVKYRRRIYVILRIKYCNIYSAPQTPFKCFIGNILPQSDNPLLREYIAAHINTAKTSLTHMRASARSEIHERTRRLQQFIEEGEVMLQWL